MSVPIMGELRSSAPPFRPAPPPPLQGELITASMGETLIPIMNKIRGMISDFGISSGIEFPTIAILGSNESGKSRLVEVLVGRNFLHRTANRSYSRPLRIELVNSPLEDEWGEFMHQPGHLFYDFYKIGNELMAESLRDAKGKGISNKEICLKIFSPSVLTLTIVDLPEIQDFSTGELSSDDVSRFELISRYMKLKTCAILLTCRASVGFRDSHAFRLAKHFDPKGSRTLGVITKTDKMGVGTNALHLIREGRLLFKLGCFCIANRTQLDVDLSFKVEDSLLYEGRFFNNQPVYQKISDYCGVRQLSKRLTGLFVEHLRQCMKSTVSTVVENEIVFGCKVSELKYKTGQLHKILEILQDCSRDLDRLCQTEDQSLKIDGSEEAFMSKMLAGCSSDRNVSDTLELLEPEIKVRTALRDAMHAALFRPRLVPLIFRANARMKEESPTRYAPRTIAMGPYCHAFPCLKIKENLKEKFMLSYLSE